MQTIATESICAVAIPVTKLVAPGPEVAKHTPTAPVALEYASLACAAPCSCRTKICSMKPSCSHAYSSS